MAELPTQLTYHVDAANNRELIINGWRDGSIEICIYRRPDRVTTRYTVDLPHDQVVQLHAALVDHIAGRPPETR